MKSENVQIEMVGKVAVATIRNPPANALTPELRVEFIDRFGLLPEATRNLFEITELRLLAERIGLEKIDANDNGARLLFGDQPDINPGKLIELIQTSPKLYRFNGSDALNITKAFPADATRIQTITDVLHSLSECQAA